MKWSPRGGDQFANKMMTPLEAASTERRQAQGNLVQINAAKPRFPLLHLDAANVVVRGDVKMFFVGVEGAITDSAAGHDSAE